MVSALTHITLTQANQKTPMTLVQRGKAVLLCPLLLLSLQLPPQPPLLCTSKTCTHVTHCTHVYNHQTCLLCPLGYHSLSLSVCSVDMVGRFLSLSSLSVFLSSLYDVNMCACMCVVCVCVSLSLSLSLSLPNSHPILNMG